MDKNQIYRKFLTILENIILRNYVDDGIIATNDFGRSVESVINGNSLKVLGAAHVFQIVNGRRPGTMPPVEAIKRWIREKKGLPAFFRQKIDSIAWAIAINIKKKGITVPNQYNDGELINKSVNEFMEEHFQDMLSELGQVFVFDIRNTIRTAFAA